MSNFFEKCEAVKVTKNYGTYPNCFLDEDNQPACTYDVAELECGLNLNMMIGDFEPQLPELFRIAGRTLSPNILSRTDILSEVLAADVASYEGDSSYHEKVMNGFESLPVERRKTIQMTIERFYGDARALFEKMFRGRERIRTLLKP